MEFERIVRWTPAYDERHSDPDYGIHGMRLAFILKRDRRAVQFVIFTNWHLEHVQNELDARLAEHSACHPLPIGLGYHSLEPIYEYDIPLMHACDVLGDGPCYYGVSGLAAKAIYWRFVAEGDSAVWKALEDYYTSRFEEAR